MNIDLLTELFKWMCIINIFILLISTISIILLRNILQTYHSKLFGISEQSVLLMAYGYLGIFKIFLIVFNIVPYVALLIIN